ncbi:MAG: hypothetical protein JSV16_02125 [Candidatus Hydrogenedentota bacterium]|nr:MAG: hypothetical protein JSV16_02125 [Candidatus Hydrogenedentota bacterium]
MKMPVQVRLMLELHKLERNGGGVDKAEFFRRIEKGLDPGLLKLYRKLRERKGTGIAVLKDGACSECMLVYPETHEMLRYKNSVHFCEFCGRLLVVTEKVA